MAVPCDGVHHRDRIHAAVRVHGGENTVVVAGKALLDVTCACKSAVGSDAP